MPATIAAESATENPPDLATLRHRIDEILHRRHVPGAGIALVRRDGVEWVTGVGLMDVAAVKAATADTLFRIGSTSKMFVGLSVLKLQREGKLNLQDTLRSRAPDLEFHNDWEPTDPVRLVHLLEHTTGWDDTGLSEYAVERDQEVSLKEGLALRPVSRTSRWRPGTRYAYCNLGPAAAAYVVEQITGQRFEDYVEQTWFQPLGMRTASFFGTPEVQERLTKLYRNDGTSALPYWKINTRPSGAVNASAREMASLIEFFLNRGTFHGNRLLPAEDIERMERSNSSYAGSEGLTVSYGLGNYASPRDGWVFHGHNGGVIGGVTEFAYSPEAGVGYVAMLNAGSMSTLGEIARELRRHLLAEATPPSRPPVVAVPPEIGREYSGWYEFASPRLQMMYVVGKLTGLTHIEINESQLTWRPLGGRPQSFVAVNARQFRRENAAAPSLALIANRADGTFIQTGGVEGVTLRRVSVVQVWWEAASVGLTALLIASTLLFALVWGPRRLFGGLRTAPHFSVRVLPLLGSLSALALGVGFVLPLTSLEFLPLLGRLTPWSFGIFGLSLALPVLAVAGLIQALRHRRAINAMVWWHSLATSLALAILSVYLGSQGLIGLRLWV